jgi:hypothetical protein
MLALGGAGMRTILGGFVFFVAVAAVGCEKPNPDYCCISADNSECPEVVNCNDGRRCVEKTCVRNSCTVDADCPTNAPACSDGLCYECGDNVACPNSGVCNDAHSCIECDATHACPNDAACTADNKCVQCDDGHACPDNGVCIDQRCAECDATHVCTTQSPVCDPDAHTCGDCTNAADCATFAPASTCDMTTGACVECTGDIQCHGTTPICDTNACRACKLDAECTSGACGPDGACVAEDAILFITSNGVCGTAGTRAEPLCWQQNAVNAALSTTRYHVVFLPGITQGRVILHSTTIPRIYLHGHGATLNGQSTTLPAIDASTAVTITGLTLGTNAYVAVSNATFEFNSVSFVGAPRLLVASGSLVANDLSFTNAQHANGAIQIDANADLTIHRGRIVGGTIGIAAIASGARFHLENVAVTGTTGHALELALGSGEISFSTISGGASSTAAPCAVTCTSLTSVTSSIIWQPTCGGQTRDAAGTCAFATSIVSNATGSGFTNVDPKLTNVSIGDVHISATSPAKDAVITGPATDYEGDPRPRGVKYDIGADEAP